MTIISHRHKFIFIKPRKVAGSSVQIALAPWCGAEDVISDGGLTFRSDVDTDEFRPPPVQHAGWQNRYGYVAQHALPDTIRTKVGSKVWDEYFKFTIVRNPWDLFVSFYHYRLHVSVPLDSARWRQYLQGNLKAPMRVHLLRLLRGIHRLATGRSVLPVPMRGFLASTPERFWCTRLRRDLATGHRKEGVEFALRRGFFAKPIADLPEFYFCDGHQYTDYMIRFENLQEGFDTVCRRLHLPHTTLPRSKSAVRPQGDDYRAYYTDYSRAHIARRCQRMIETFGYRFDGLSAA